MYLIWLAKSSFHSDVSYMVYPFREPKEYGDKPSEDDQADSQKDQKSQTGLPGVESIGVNKPLTKSNE